MRTANTHKNMARCAATATLACVLGLGLAAPAYADTASDLAAARTKLEQIGTQTQQIYDELATQTQALDQTAGEITQKQQEIADGQAKLSTYVAGEYKTGGLSLLQVLTGVDDLSDMLNRLFYYGKVSDKQAQTIQEVKELKQQLTDKQTEQEKNVATTQKKVDELNAQQAEAQNVVNSLDSQLQAELAAEAEANAALQAGINASTAEKATVSNETAGTTENTNNGGQTSNNNNQGGNTPAPTPAPARRRSPLRLPRLRRLLLRASQSMAVLLSRVHTASLVALIPGAELARTASTALVLLVIASLVAIAAWAPRVPLWAGRVCPIRSPVTLWSTRTTPAFTSVVVR